MENFFEVSQGLIAYDKYRGHSRETIEGRVFHADYQKDASYKKELKGRDISRYNCKWNGNLWISYGEWIAAIYVKDFAEGNHKGLPLQINWLRRGNPLWLLNGSVVIAFIKILNVNGSEAPLENDKNRENGNTPL